MGHKHNLHQKKKRKEITGGGHRHDPPAGHSSEALKSLELVLKCDSEGSREAILKAIKEIRIVGFDLRVISSGVGEITKSDLFMAGTANSLIIGYEIEVNKAIEVETQKAGVEVRLYTVIYRLLDDLKNIGESFLAVGREKEMILGRAKVIALFKSCRKGIILGCEILEGRLARGDRFRVIGAMGQIYFGRIGSLHMDRVQIDSAGKGRQVGLKIENFNKAVVGDFVEAIRFMPPENHGWHPVPGIKRIQ